MIKQSQNQVKDPVYSILICFFIATSAISLYIIPYGVFPDYILSVSTLLVLSILLLLCIVFGLSIHRSDINLIFLLALMSLFYFSGTKLYYLMIVSILLIGCRSVQNPNKKIVWAIYFISFISIINQLIHQSTGRDFYTLSVPDPNFSGFYMLIFFMFCFRNNFILGILLSILCVFLFLSRTYAVSLGLFMLIYLFEVLFLSKLKKKRSSIPFLKIFNKNFLLPLVLVANISIYFSSFYIVDIASLMSGGSFARDNIQRLVTVNADDTARFEVNLLVIKALINEPNVLLFGIPERTPEYITHFADTDFVPHNSLLRLVLECGLIFSFYYLFLVGIILKRLYTHENLKYILSFLLFSLFLHVAYQPIFFVFIISIFSLPERHKKITLAFK
ncbi:hypothetical protein KBT16_11575 [Nostoc sp. CCCryo 231-06]|nr:hypothetical protein [Nostoc sp. CCCryo 231-06]